MDITTSKLRITVIRAMQESNVLMSTEFQVTGTALHEVLVGGMQTPAASTDITISECGYEDRTADTQPPFN